MERRGRGKRGRGRRSSIMKLFLFELLTNGLLLFLS
jgi:hypothetical protein